MADLLIIEHRDGRSYAVSAADFRKGADDEYKGFKPLRHESGAEYEAPAKAAEKPAEMKQDEK